MIRQRSIIDRFRSLTIGAESVDLAPLRVLPQGVGRESGQIALFEEQSNLKPDTETPAQPPTQTNLFDIQGREPVGLRQMNNDTFAPKVPPRHPALLPRLAYRFSSSEFELPLTASRRRPAAVVTSEHGLRVELRTIHLASRFRIDLKELPRDRIAFTLPEEYRTVEVTTGQLSDWHISPGAAGSILTIEFEQPAPRTGRADSRWQDRPQTA